MKIIVINAIPSQNYVQYAKIEKFISQMKKEDVKVY